MNSMLSWQGPSRPRRRHPGGSASVCSPVEWGGCSRPPPGEALPASEGAGLSGNAKQIPGGSLTSRPTTLSLPGAPESPPSHQVENSPSKACPRWARGSHPLPHANPGPPKSALCPPPASRALRFNGKALASEPGSKLASQAERCRRAGDHSDPQSPLLQMVSITPTLGLGRWASSHSMPWASKRSSRSRDLTRESSRQSPHPAPQAGKESGSGGPQPPKGLTGTNDRRRLIRA